MKIKKKVCGRVGGGWCWGYGGCEPKIEDGMKIKKSEGRGSGRGGLVGGHF